jgi:hypothetical protein
MPSAETRHPLIGALVAASFGLVLLAMGGRLIIYDHLLASAVRAAAEITSAGSTRSSGSSSVNFVRYRFTDPSGRTFSGTSAGYSGRAGDSLLVEYVPRFPYIHRVAGEGRTSGYRWRWYIAGAGLFFLVVGTHWGWSLRARAREQR